MTKKFKKNCKFCQKMLKLVMLKSWKIFYYIQKLCSNILSNPGVGSSTPRADKNQKMTIFKTFEKKIEKISKCEIG